MTGTCSLLPEYPYKQIRIQTLIFAQLLMSVIHDLLRPLWLACSRCRFLAICEATVTSPSSGSWIIASHYLRKFSVPYPKDSISSLLRLPGQ